MRALVAFLICVATLAHSAPVEQSLRPVPRPDGASGSGVALQPSGTIKPAVRPENATSGFQAASGVTQSLRPKLRPRKILRIGREQERLRQLGAVCSDVDIQGDVVGRVPGTIKGCGLSDAVRIRSVSGIALSRQAVMDCTTAKALKSWIEDTAKPTLQREGGGLVQLRVAAHYACRTRNSMPGARVSEHGRGRAIDISGVRLRDGREISVLKGWNDPASAKFMRQLHAGACGPFGTVLGPASDRFHRDHFHFDTARYRSGPFCR